VNYILNGYIGRKQQQLTNTCEESSKHHMSSNTTTITLLTLPRHLLIYNILLCYLSAKDCRCLLSTCHEYLQVLGMEDDLWHTLLERRRLSWWTSKPIFPGAGTWKDVYMRTLGYQTLILVQTLTKPEGPYLKLVVSRSMPLFALKREIRNLQFNVDGISLEDFDLVDYQTNESLEVAGNDSLPPQDLGRLFWLNTNNNNNNNTNNPPIPALISTTTSTTRDDVPNRPRRRYSRDPWRRYTSQIPDGTLLRQCFVDVHGNPILTTSSQSQLAECEAIIKRVEQEENFNHVGTSHLLETLTHALEKAHTQLGPTGFKMYWRKHQLHPLLRVTFSNNAPVLERMRSLLLFGKAGLMKSIWRKRFLSDVFVRSFLTSGFLVSFSRLCFLLFPMIWKTQVMNIFDADFDLIFAFRLARDVIKVTYQAFMPVFLYAFKVELLRVFASLTFTRETRFENALLVLVVGLLQTIKSTTNNSIGQLSNFQHHIFPQYVLSAACWWLFETQSDYALSVSLPMYLYALPLVVCAVVLRLRMFLAQSYLSLIIQY
jgi:hypothetical protein